MQAQVQEAQVDLRRFGGQFPAGVAVISTRDAAGRCTGITMNAIGSLSLGPPIDGAVAQTA